LVIRKSCRKSGGTRELWGRTASLSRVFQVVKGTEQPERISPPVCAK
jgi:hypothetical protein